VVPWSADRYARKVRRGNVGHLTIREDRHFVLISGSLAKAILGNNFDCPLFSAVQNFFEALQSLIDGDLYGGQVVWIENGVTVKLDDLVAEHLLLFGEMPPFQRDTYGTPLQTRLYRTARESVQGYNKVAAALAKNEVIPPWWVGVNAFRWEYKGKKDVSGIFGRPIFVRDLCDPHFQTSLDQKTLALYRSVPKIRVPRTFGENVFSQMDLLWSLASLCVQLVGLDIVQNQLLARRPFVQAHNFRRMRERLTEVALSPLYSDKHPLIDELSCKLSSAFNQDGVVEPVDDHLPGGPL
jgi:hypothetical protein